MRMRILLLAQAIAAALLTFLCYVNLSSPLWVRWGPWLALGYAALSGLAQLFIKADTDEYAAAALRHAEAVCLQAAVIWMALLFAVCLLAQPLYGTMALLLLCGLAGLTLLRAALFIWYDRKGTP